MEVRRVQRCITFVARVMLQRVSYTTRERKSVFDKQEQATSDKVWTPNAWHRASPFWRLARSWRHRDSSDLWTVLGICLNGREGKVF